LTPRRGAWDNPVRPGRPAGRDAIRDAGRPPRVAAQEASMPNITVQWYAGRTDQQRREIVAAFTEAMVRIGKTTPDQVHIVFQDVERTHWGVNGRLASDA
jgi:4-oxalocrotonate tautomerase